jgi:3-oxoacyl-[acyl-carrier protein] reductase
MIDPGLRGRTVLVTGANSPLGIGAAIAAAFAAVGAKLFLHYYRTPFDQTAGTDLYRRQQQKSCDEVIQRLAAAGADADAYEADLTDPTEIVNVVEAAERRCGSVDVLVNNAATWSADTFVPRGKPVRNTFLELWTESATPLSAESSVRQFVGNAVAPAVLTREFARRHAARQASWGRIINISTDGSDGFPGEISYGASKFALESFTRSAAHELGQFGITVNVLSLGPVQTGWITPALERAIVPSIPLGRIGTPDDVADVVVFLASEQARWVTGQRIHVGGGHRM